MNHDKIASGFSPSASHQPPAVARHAVLAAHKGAEVDSYHEALAHPPLALALTHAPAKAAEPTAALGLPCCPSPTGGAREPASPDRTPPPDVFDAEAALASFESLRVRNLSEDYKAHVVASQAAWDIHDGLVERDSLGTLNIVAGTLADAASEVPPFEVRCERLSAACDVAEKYGDLVRCLQQPAVRTRFLEKNDVQALQQVEHLAASGVVRGSADHHKVANQIAMANCNASLSEFMARMLQKGKLQPDEPRVLAYEATRAWANHGAVLQACAPIAEQVSTIAQRNDEGVSDVTHVVWMRWLQASYHTFTQDVSDIWSRVQQTLTD